MEQPPTTELAVDHKAGGDNCFAASQFGGDASPAANGRAPCRSRGMRVPCGAALIVVALSGPVAAQDVGVHDSAPPHEAAAAAGSAAATSARVLGVLPNYGTVERNVAVAPVSRRWMLDTTARNTFDPCVFSFTGVTTALGQGGAGTYAERYATSFADNAIGNFLTSAAFPSMLNQDSRYYQLGTGGVGRRAWYALSRIAAPDAIAAKRGKTVEEILARGRDAFPRNGP